MSDYTMTSHEENGKYKDSAIGTSVDKLKNLTNKEKYELNEFLQEDHLAAVPHDHSDTEIKSAGETTFNVVTYKGIGFLLNAGISIYLTDLLMHGKGRPLCDKIIETITPAFKTPGKTAQMAFKQAESTVFTASLFSGGTILLYPIKKLEDYKPQIVEYIDDQYNQYFKPDKATLDIQKNAHQRLRNDAIPGWKTVLFGRALSYLVNNIVIVGIGRGRDIKFTQNVAEKTAEVLKESNSGWMKKLGSLPKFKRLTSVTLMELYSSFMAEEVLYFTTRTYKKLKRNGILSEKGNDNTQPHEKSPELDNTETITPYSDNDKKEAKWVEKAPKTGSHQDKLVDMNETESLGLGV